jgi:hypothetical protein
LFNPLECPALRPRCNEALSRIITMCIAKQILIHRSHNCVMASIISIMMATFLATLLDGVPKSTYPLL